MHRCGVALDEFLLKADVNDVTAVSRLPSRQRVELKLFVERTKDAHLVSAGGPRPALHRRKVITVKRSTSVLLIVGDRRVLRSFAYHVASAGGTPNRHELLGSLQPERTTLVSTLAPAGVAGKDCSPGVGCWYGYRASDGRRTSWYVPHGQNPKTACSTITGSVTGTRP